MHTVTKKVFIRNVSLRFYAKSKFCVCFEVHIPVSKQIRLCAGSGAPARNSQVTLTSLGQSKAKTLRMEPTISLGRYGWNMSKEGSLRRKKKKKKNKVAFI